MKTFSELIKNTHVHLTENESVDSIADRISFILERTEQILNRKLTNEEFETFSEILVEEEMEKEDKDKPKPTFQEGKYTVEIMTSEGKVTRTASTQKGLLSVLPKKGFSYRVLYNGKDITAKLKSFIKERQKQALLRQKMIKKLKEETERVGFKFERFFNLREEDTSSREKFYQEKLKEIEARTDLSPEQKAEASSIIQDQLNRAKTGPKKIEKGEEVTSGVSVKGGAFEKDSPAPRRDDYDSEDDWKRDTQAWSNVQKGIAKTEQEAGIDVESVARESLNDPVAQIALTAGLFVPGANLAAGALLATGGALNLKHKAETGELARAVSGEAGAMEYLGLAGDILSIVPGAGLAKTAAKEGIGAAVKSGTGLFAIGPKAFAGSAKTVADDATKAVAGAAEDVTKAAAKTADDAASAGVKPLSTADDAAKAVAGKTDDAAKAVAGTTDDAAKTAVKTTADDAAKVGAKTAADDAAKVVTGAADDAAKAGIKPLTLADDAARTGAKTGSSLLRTAAIGGGAAALTATLGGKETAEQSENEPSEEPVSKRSFSSDEEAKKAARMAGANISYV
jgi:hypothetical protein